jgi:hypothetical protein
LLGKVFGKDQRVDERFQQCWRKLSPLKLMTLCRELYGTDKYRTKHQDIHPARSSYKEAVVD